MTPDGKTRVMITLPDDLLADVDRRADSMRVHRSRLIAAALHYFLADLDAGKVTVANPLGDRDKVRAIADHGPQRPE